MSQQFDYKTFLKTLPNLPGVYQMVNKQGQVLYVGKAKNLKKRVSSYFTRTILETKTLSLMEQVDHVTVTITRNDNEALLLENNLIKELKPRYNVLLRDDKSYPYLYLSTQSVFPRLDFHRGPRRAPGKYFGPYPSASSVRETLTLLQKLFKLRQCSDSFFAHRTRPCLQYHIKRCTAPCVAYIDAEKYGLNVQHAILFLEGKSNEVIDDLAKKMDAAASDLEFENAARYRDQIVSLRRIQEQQYINSHGGDVDVIAIATAVKESCIHVISIRKGRIIGSRSFFPNAPEGSLSDEVLSAFITQYYLNPVRGSSFPDRVILNLKFSEAEWVENALAEQLHHKIEFIYQVRGKHRQWLRMAISNAENMLQSHLAGKANFYRRMEALQQTLKLANLPQRLECFDVSHTRGEATVASCVVFDIEGPRQRDYRRFNIEGIVEGDDYAALRQAILRRYTKLKAGEGILPDVLFIDGGKGQLHQAEQVLEELQVTGVTLVAIAKGEGRKPGLETLYFSGDRNPINLNHDSLALHVIQQIRDEAHRFAITAHRQRRGKARSKSILDDVPGVGPKRRRELLRQFGGIQELQRASVEDIAKIPGISLSLAQRIYDVLHSG